MYSRKYIRSQSQPPFPRTEGRVALPPDYTGTAFIPERSVRPEDFPETVIEPIAEKAIPAEHPLPWEEETAEEVPAKSDEETPAPLAEEAEGPPSIEEAESEPSPQPPLSPLLTTEFLRSLTLEDLLLCWLLLMLLSCRQEDQIYLLLGLLLLGR